jgi:hypothetical protein
MPLGGGAFDAGSGAYLGLAGYVLTAEHVVRGHTSGYVTFSDGVRRAAKVLATDRHGDMALLKIKPHPSLAGIRVAEAKPAIGSRLWFSGHGGFPTRGYLIGSGTVVEAERCTTINWREHRPRQGDSGGPVWNATGLVSVISGYSPGHTATGCGLGRLRVFLRNILPRPRKTPPVSPGGKRPPLEAIPGGIGQPNPTPPASTDIALLKQEIEALKILMAKMQSQAGVAGRAGRDGKDGRDGKNAKINRIELANEIQRHIKLPEIDYERIAGEIQKRISFPATYEVVRRRK